MDMTTQMTVFSKPSKLMSLFNLLTSCIYSAVDIAIIIATVHASVC